MPLRQVLKGTGPRVVIPAQGSVQIRRLRAVRGSGAELAGDMEAPREGPHLRLAYAGRRLPDAHLATEQYGSRSPPCPLGDV